MRYVTALGLGAAGMISFAATPSAQAADLSGSVSANAAYESNIARASDAVADARGVAQDDVIGDILATFDLKAPMGRQQTFVRGSVGYRAYKRNTDLNGLQTDLQAGVTRTIARCDVTASGSYSRAQSDLADISFEDAENTLERRAVDVSVGCAKVIGLSPSLRVSQDWVENSAAGRQDADSETLSGRAGVVYRGPAVGAISLYGEYQETKYPNRLGLFNGELIQDGFEVYTGGLQYERELGARIQGSIYGSYTTLQPDFPDVPEFEGITYGARLSYRMGSRINAELSFNRDVDPSDRLNSTYALTEAYRLQATYAMGPRMSVMVGGSHEDSEIQGDALRPGLDVMDDQTRAVFGSVSMKLNERVSISVDARHEEREADVAGFDYQNERVAVSASAAF